MKTILEFKKEKVIVPKPEKCWEELFTKVSKYLSENYNIDVDNVTVNKEIDPLCNNFENIFLIEFIKTALNLPKNPLWDNILSINCTNSTVFGHNGEICTYNFFLDLKGKLEVLENINGKWVYENSSLVNDFMNPENDLYRKLVSIRRDLFPLTLSIELNN